MISYSSSTVHLQFEILYAFPTPPATSSPSPFRGCTFKSFGRSLPFRYASQIRLKLHTDFLMGFEMRVCPGLIGGVVVEQFAGMNDGPYVGHVIL